MNTKYVLKIFSYDNGFILNSLLDGYESLSVKYNKYQSHELNITINRNIPNTQDLKEGNFIWLGSVQDGMFLITTVTESIDENGKGGNYINVQAKDCRYLYKRRMIMAINSVETWTETGTAETVLRHLISSQTEGKRSLPINNVIPNNPVGEQISLSEAKTNLYDVVCNYCQQGNIGWKVTFDGYVLTLVFFPVTDISSLVKFTVDYESLKNGEFEDSSENYKNVVYVGGKGSGNNQVIYEAEDEIEGGSPSGIDRIETWISEGSLTTEDELQKVGESKLIEFSQKLNFTGNGLEKSPFEFRVHYDIGNIVEVAFGDRSDNVEIISIQESWAYNEYDMQFEFGKPLNYLSNQVKKIYNLLQKYNSTDAKTNSEVKYYTIPTDTEQPIGDVGLDVIGFIGNTGDANKTFTLFFSADGTGAKTYHVYFKQLSGTGKLILTTGVQGTEQLEFSTGTYVAIIYVDENGNVKNSFGISDYITSSQTAWSGEKTQTEINDVRGDIPTKTSELNNDSGFITGANIPTKTSDLINDSGFITSPTHDYYFDLRSYPSDRFYALFIYSSEEVELYVSSTSTVDGEPYNNNYLHGFFRTYGWADIKTSIRILTFGMHDTSEQTIMGISRGATQGGFAIYVRGGVDYTVKCNYDVQLKLSNFDFGTDANKETFVSDTTDWKNLVFLGNVGVWIDLANYKDADPVSIMSGKIYGTITDAENVLTTYSTNETRIGTWIDGKPLYRRVIYCFQSKGTFNINIGGNIGVLTRSSIIASSDVNYSVDKAVTDGSSNENVDSLVNGDVIYFRSDKYVHYAILEYTKTTD